MRAVAMLLLFALVGCRDGGVLTGELVLWQGEDQVASEQFECDVRDAVAVETVRPGSGLPFSRDNAWSIELAVDAEDCTGLPAAHPLETLWVASRRDTEPEVDALLDGAWSELRVLGGEVLAMGQSAGGSYVVRVHEAWVSSADRPDLAYSDVQFLDLDFRGTIDEAETRQQVE